MAALNHSKMKKELVCDYYQLFVKCLSLSEREESLRQI